ncbi:DNA/RNA non-specific endonuclease [Polaribacter glomeratus]|uniref:Endonuclease n=1 Tax=Polaribacter glomeratus TaxID=102 RepID=A0A2S7WIK6_9FLAO|nr:DNA/RNA non-specific endonuclease [Polaribacter glomeratus]PQJ77424.1 endonuclease [Polaribacter glomeratus]TXD66010.1 DNA/RNA non-specific endonuclease [Polaribacter glomeratus]
MKKRIISAILLIIVLSYYLYQDKKESFSSDKTDTSEHFINDGFNYLPTSTTGVIINHEGYNLSYSEKHEQAEWVAYSLEKNEIVYTNRKRPYFIEDPKIKTKSADWRNYKKSGYDKGHLCPAADRRASEESYNETFYTSNITPQNHGFNAGIWNELEQQTRYWAKKYNRIYVISGGVLVDNLRTIGSEKVAVPNQFYKILLDYTAPEIKTIAFLIPHKNSNQPLQEFVVSIDEIEQLTGIDFFPNLPDDLENKLEKSSNYKNWSFKSL